MECVRASLEQGKLATVEYSLCTHLGEEREFEVRVARRGPTRSWRSSATSPICAARCAT